jgi:hypothetical protein
MAQISKEQIEQLLKTDRLFKGETDMLQGLLDQPAITKMEIPPPQAEMTDVVFAEGWNAACETYFGGLPPQEALIITMMDSTHPAPFAHPVDDGSDWFYKLQFICRVLQSVSPDKTDLQTALGMAQTLRADRWNAEMALMPITSSDVTDEMMANFIRGHTDNMTYQKTFIAAVNAYMGAKK